MKYFIYQGNDHDCGFAALKIYLAMLAKDKSYLYIPKPTKREHYSCDDLMKIASWYGIKLELFGCNKDFYDDLDVPSLTLIDENHVVVVKKLKKNKIVLYDPARGLVKMKKEEFLRRWRNIILSTDNPESITKIKKIRQHLLPPKLEILSTSVSFISAIVLITSFYLLNRTENFLYSLIFLFAFVGMQILEKMILYKQVYKFDLEYIPRYFDIKRNCNKEKYLQFNNYKHQFFTHNRQLISSVLLAFSITFLLCFNDFRNVFVLFALVLLKLIEIVLFAKNDQFHRNQISELENRSFNEPTEAKDLALQANTKADSFIFASSIKEIVFIFISFVFAVLMMFITGNAGCNFVIFHFVMYYAGFNAYNHLIDSLSNKKDMMKFERRFFDSCNL